MVDKVAVFVPSTTYLVLDEPRGPPPTPVPHLGAAVNERKWWVVHAKSWVIARQGGGFYGSLRTSYYEAYSSSRGAEMSLTSCVVGSRNQVPWSTSYRRREIPTTWSDDFRRHCAWHCALVTSASEVAHLVSTTLHPRPRSNKPPSSEWPSNYAAHVALFEALSTADG